MIAAGSENLKIVMILRGKVLALIGLLLVGCSPLLLKPLDLPPPRRVTEKNYTIGQKQTAFVGQAIIRVKNYLEIQTPCMKANTYFSVNSGSIDIKGKVGEVYPIKALINYKGKEYLVVDITAAEESHLEFASGELRGLLVDLDGNPTDKFFTRSLFSWAIRKVKVSPGTLRFEKTYEKNLIEGQPNFEIIYTGTNGKSLFALYREYTSKGLARPAFSMNLVYDASVGVIRFRNLVIRIHEITNEKVVYTVVDE